MFTTMPKRICAWSFQKETVYLLLGILCLLGSVTLTANAMLTVSSSGLLGSADVAVDGNGTLNLGTASSTGIVIGKSSIPVTLQGSLVTVPGNMRLTGALFDSTNASGTAGMILQSTTTGTQWVATSTLGISGGSSLWTASGTDISYNSGNVTIGIPLPPGTPPAGPYINSQYGFFKNGVEITGGGGSPGGSLGSMQSNSPLGTLFGDGSFIRNTSALPVPAAPAVTTSDAGSNNASWGYACVAGNIYGLGTPTAATTITGNNTLDSGHENTITCAPVVGSSFCAIWRTTAGGTPSSAGRIDDPSSPTACGTPFIDNGLTADGLSINNLGDSSLGLAYSVNDPYQTAAFQLTPEILHIGALSDIVYGTTNILIASAEGGNVLAGGYNSIVGLGSNQITAGFGNQIFGDDFNTISVTANNSIYGNFSNTISGGSNNAIFGNDHNTISNSRGFSLTLGNYTNITANSAVVLGIGLQSAPLLNAAPNTLCIGMDTDTCSLIVGDAGGVAGNHSPIIMPGLPTSCSGQASGTLYDTGTSATGGGTALGICH